MPAWRANTSYRALSSSAEYRPPRWLRSPHVQSLLASSPLRRALIERRLPELGEITRPIILECPDGARLEAWVSIPDAPRGLAILLHGWEGSVSSSYMVEAAGALLDRDFAVARLHFRDHGATHHLNEGIFHSCRLDEVVAAVDLLAQRHEPLPVVLGGYSLGGNFALRVALAGQTALQQVVAISPPIEPSAGLAAIESAPAMYQYYFMRKWRRSLREKQRQHPHLYHWGSELMRKSLLETTAWLVEQDTEFANVDEYFAGYTVGRDALRDLQTPVTIITAADDPIIPVEGFRALELGPHSELIITQHGGHCGFIQDGASSWATAQMVERMERAIAGR